MLGTATAENQSLLLAESHHVQGYCEGSYDGVLGLGHRRYAREGDADPALLATLGLSAFSICYGRNEDDPGRRVAHVAHGLHGLREDVVPVHPQEVDLKIARDAPRRAALVPKLVAGHV